MKPSSTKIALIGTDTSLAYLITRFAEQCGYQVTVLRETPTVEEIWSKKPCIVLFSSMESLESAQGLVSRLADGDILVGVCSLIGDEARAHELGADRCFLHPLTYDSFVSALRSDGPAGVSKAGRGRSKIDG